LGIGILHQVVQHRPQQRNITTDEASTSRSGSLPSFVPFEALLGALAEASALDQRRGRM
jgi:hypothetical protein